MTRAKGKAEAKQKAVQPPTPTRTKNIAIHEMGHVAAYWEFGEVHTPTIYGEHGGAGFVESRSDVPPVCDDDGELTPEQDTIAALAGGAAEYAFTPQDVGEISYGMQEDLRHVVDDFQFDIPEWDAAVELVQRYEQQILEGAKLLATHDSLSAEDVIRIFKGVKQ